MKKRALFVGVDEYEDGTISDLGHAVDDSESLAAVFETLLGFDRVEKLRNPAGKKDILGKVSEVTGGLKKGDLFFFFFAGHGFRVKENHVLVCKKDLYADLEDEYDGLPMGQLKKRMRGPWDRMLVIDACQNDIRKTRGADEGIAGRDLALILEDGERDADNPDFDGEGVQVVVTSCSEGQKALEVEELGHGLFTSALLETVKEHARMRTRLDMEGFREEMGARMGALAKRYRLGGKQNPMFRIPGECGVVLLEGDIRAGAGERGGITMGMPVPGAEDSDGVAEEEYRKASEILAAGGARAWENAAVHFRRSAELGHTDAQYQFGEMLIKGKGVDCDPHEAFAWHEKAAARGHLTALFHVGLSYFKGRGVEQNDGKALEAFVKAARQGHPRSMYMAGFCHDAGRGTAKDHGEAMRWYRKAAAQGVGEAARIVEEERRRAEEEADALAAAKKATAERKRRENLARKKAERERAEEEARRREEAEREAERKRKEEERLARERERLLVERAMAEEAKRRAAEEAEKARQEVERLQREREAAKAPAERERRKPGFWGRLFGIGGDERMPVAGSRPGPSGLAPGAVKRIRLKGAWDEVMEMVWCPAGRFPMGAAPGEKMAEGNERQHWVEIGRGFWIGKYPVTQRQWRAVMGGEPSRNFGPECPVEQVTWFECREFCERAGGRLPLEAEWEYACRAGNAGPYGGSDLDAMGWYRENSGGMTHPVGQKRPNAWGLYDMHGNVWEWCGDDYAKYPDGDVVVRERTALSLEYYADQGAQRNDGLRPAGATYIYKSGLKVMRGGGWGTAAEYCRSASRVGVPPGTRDGVLGFRMVLDG